MPDDGEFPFPIIPIFTSERGEGWVAARDVNEGEVVLRVMPIAAVPNSTAVQTTCAGCFSAMALHSLSLCPHCKVLSFCSKCLSSAHASATPRHDDCEALALLRLESMEDIHEDTTALRLILRLVSSRRELESTSKNPDVNAENNNEDDDEEEEDVIMDNLTTDVDDLFGSSDDFNQETLDLYTEVCKRIKHLLPARHRTSLHNLLQLASKLHFNGMDITMQPAADSPSSSQAGHGIEPRIQGGAIGEALYPSAARFNHSCDPNCGLSFIRGRLEVRAARSISKGSELFISYVGVDHLQLKAAAKSRGWPGKKGRGTRGEGDVRGDLIMSGSSRRERLFKTYGFECKCDLCVKEGR